MSRLEILQGRMRAEQAGKTAQAVKPVKVVKPKVEKPKVAKVPRFAKLKPEPPPPQRASACILAGINYTKLIRGSRVDSLFQQDF
jgi:hypothetical protein